MKQVIEFCGLPGSGKTTLYETFVGALSRLRPGTFGREAAVTACIRRRDDGLLKNVLKRFPPLVWKRFMGSEFALPELEAFVGARVGLLAHVSRALAERDVPARYAQVTLGAFFKNFAECELVRRYLRPDETFVMDEGNSHRAITLYGYLPAPPPESEIREYADLIPKPDVVFWTDADPALCEARIATRGKKPYRRPFQLEDLALPERVRRLAPCRACIAVVADQLKVRGVDVIRIDTNGKQSETVAAAKTWAARMAGHTDPPRAGPADPKRRQRR